MSDRWLYRAIIALYQRQTTEEQARRTTNVWNGRGYNFADAYILSSFAERLLNGCQLSAQQREVARDKLPKYSRQLTNIANHTEEN